MTNTIDSNNFHISNGHKPKKNQSLSTLSKPQLSEDSKPPALTKSGDDWSYATKELLDTLPQAWTRGLLYFLVVFVGIAVPWAILSQIDETGTARGRLEPKEQITELDAPVLGTVAAINVKPGQQVKAGQTILTLESKLVDTKLLQEQSKLEGQQNRLYQLDLLKNQLMLVIRTQKQQNQAQLLEKQAKVQEARAHLESLQSLAKLHEREQQALVEQAKKEVASSQIAHKLAEIQLQGAKEKYQRYQQAYEQGVISKDRFQEVEQLVKEKQQLIVETKFKISQAESRQREKESSYQRIIQQSLADIQGAQMRWKQQQNGYQSLLNSGELALLKSEEQYNKLSAEITTLTSEIAQTKSKIESLKFQLQQRVIKAPIDGIVFDLPIQTAAEVVQPGDKIAEIAPLGEHLVLRGQILTAESGSLQKGMPVKIKFDAYPFQDYGLLSGKLVEISPNSKITENQQGQVTTYDIEVELDRSCIATSSDCIALRPGDTAIAEIIVRQRRIIDFILDPFKKLSQDGLKL